MKSITPDILSDVGLSSADSVMGAKRYFQQRGGRGFSLFSGFVFGGGTLAGGTVAGGVTAGGFFTGVFGGEVGGVGAAVAGVFGATSAGLPSFASP